jgi:hypothetical protein
MLLLFVICVVVATILVSFLRQRVEREQFKATTLARRTAGGVVVVLTLAAIFALAMFALFLFGLWRALSEGGCINC